jgi:hypothetical protein
VPVYSLPRGLIEGQLLSRTHSSKTQSLITFPSSSTLSFQFDDKPNNCAVARLESSRRYLTFLLSGFSRTFFLNPPWSSLPRCSFSLSSTHTSFFLELTYRTRTLARFLEIEITLLQGMARTLISRLLNVAYLWHAHNHCLAVSKSASSDKRKSIQCMCHDSNNLVTKESKPTYISDLAAVCFAPINSCVAPRQAMAKVHPRAQRIPPIGPQ